MWKTPLLCPASVIMLTTMATPATSTALAKAIETRTTYGAKRCAVEVNVEGAYAELWSPRNSRYRARVPLAVADDLAVKIRSLGK